MICLLNRANRRSALRSGKALGDSSTSLSLSLSSSFPFLLLDTSGYRCASVIIRCAHGRVRRRDKTSIENERDCPFSSRNSCRFLCHGHHNDERGNLYWGWRSSKASRPGREDRCRQRDLVFNVASPLLLGRKGQGRGSSVIFLAHRVPQSRPRLRF